MENRGGLWQLVLGDGEQCVDGGYLEMENGVGVNGWELVEERGIQVVKMVGFENR